MNEHDASVEVHSLPRQPGHTSPCRRPRVIDTVAHGPSRWWSATLSSALASPVSARPARRRLPATSAAITAFGQAHE